MPYNPDTGANLRYFRSCIKIVRSEGLRPFSRRTGIPLQTVANWCNAASLKQVSAFGYFELVHHTSSVPAPAKRKPTGTTRRGKLAKTTPPVDTPPGA